jgi:hypothetical protein
MHATTRSSLILGIGIDHQARGEQAPVPIAMLLVSPAMIDVIRSSNVACRWCGITSALPMLLTRVYAVRLPGRHGHGRHGTIKGEIYGRSVCVFNPFMYDNLKLPVEQRKSKPHLVLCQ